MAIGIVRPFHIRRDHAYRREGSSALCTCQCIPFESFTLKIKVNDADDLDENRQANVRCQPAYAWGKLALLGTTVGSQYIIVQHTV